jgi:molybdopterin synthase catalytic subunit
MSSSDSTSSDKKHEIRVALTRDVIDVGQYVDWASVASCGGVSTFLGTTRDNFEGRRVIRLEYDAYEEMAVLEMRKISDQIFERWPDVRRVAIVHRLGVVPVRQSSVLIVCASPHRVEAFDSCRYAIDTLKATVPIWKKEVYQEGDRIWKENKECIHHTQRRHQDT